MLTSGDKAADVFWACCKQLSDDDKDPNHPDWKMDENYHYTTLTGYLGGVKLHLASRGRVFNFDPSWDSHLSDMLAVLIANVAVKTV